MKQLMQKSLAVLVSAMLLSPAAFAEGMGGMGGMVKPLIEFWIC